MAGVWFEDVHLKVSNYVIGGKQWGSCGLVELRNTYLLKY